MAAKRIRASTAKGDIDNAFRMWRFVAASPEECSEREQEANLAESRVAAWLEQVDADAARLHKAMLACQALLAVHPAAESAAYTKARRLAAKAVEG